MIGLHQHIGALKHISSTLLHLKKLQRFHSILHNPSIYSRGLASFSTVSTQQPKEINVGENKSENDIKIIGIESDATIEEITTPTNNPTNNNNANNDNDANKHESAAIDRIFTEELLKVMRTFSREFILDSKQIRIINTPSDFYSDIISLIGQSTERICLSALYLGSAKQEQELVEAITKRLSENSNVSCHLLFDYWRGQRMDSSGKSSLVLAQNLVTKYPTRASSAFYAPTLAPLEDKFRLKDTSTATYSPVFSMPSEFNEKIRGQIFEFLMPYLPGRVKELLAVHHIKVYIFDNKVILSGANLSDIYFQQRQDRYVEISSKPLCDYLLSVIQILSLSNRSSLLTTGDVGSVAGTVTTETSTSTSTTPSCQLEKRGSCSTTIPPYWLTNSAWNINPFIDTLKTHSRQELFKQKGAELPYLATLFSPLQNCLDAKDGAEDRVEVINNTSNDINGNDIHNHTPVTLDSLPWDTPNNTLVSFFPTIQMGTLGIKQDEVFVLGILQCLRKLSEIVPNHPISIHILSGYFNMTERYIDAITSFIQSKYGRNRVRIVAAAEQANGWADAKGPTGHVPRLYSILADRFLKKVTKSRQNIGRNGNDRPVNIEILEYVRKGWSYHAKGFYAQPYDIYKKHSTRSIESDELLRKNNMINKPIDHINDVHTTVPVPQALDALDPTRPLISMFGSSNYGERSSNRDTEMNFALITRDPLLISAMSQDLRNSTSYSKPRFHQQHLNDDAITDTSATTSQTTTKNTVTRKTFNDYVLEYLALPVIRFFL